MEAKAIVQALREDKKALKELAEEIVKVPDIRLAIVNAAMREMATRGDIKELRSEMDRLREEITQNRTEIKENEENLRTEIDKVRTEIRDSRRELIAIMQIGFTGLGLLMVALSFYLKYVLK